MTGKAVFVGQNALVGTLDVLGFVGRLAYEDGVQDDTHGPDINLEGVTSFGLVVLDDFGCDIVGCSTDGFPFLLSILQTRGQAQISNFDVEVLVQKQVTEFEITVDHILIMNVLYRFQQLHHEEGRFGFRQSLSSFDHFIQTLVVTQLEEDVTIVTILKEVFVFTYVLMFECTVDLDLGLELLCGVYQKECIENVKVR